MIKHKATIYTKLSILTGKTVAELERLLNVGNGAIGKAIDRNSTVKPTTIDKIAKLYPEHCKALGIQPATTDTEKPAPTEAGLKDKYIALLESYQEDRKLLHETAKAAITAANNTTVLVSDVKKDVSDLRDSLLVTHLKYEALRDFVADVSAGYLQTTQGDIDTQLHTAFLAKMKLHGKGKELKQGKTRTLQG